jgi:hypothetical protein
MKEGVIALTGFLPRRFMATHYQYLLHTIHHRSPIGLRRNITDLYPRFRTGFLTGRGSAVAFALIFPLADFKSIDRIGLRFNMSYELRAAAQGCTSQFALLLEISEELGLTCDISGRDYNVNWIQEQYARFKIWAANIGAFAQGHASLDHRLRDNEQTQKFMLEFLVTLADFIKRGKCHFPFLSGMSSDRSSNKEQRSAMRSEYEVAL